MLRKVKAGVWCTTLHHTLFLVMILVLLSHPATAFEEDKAKHVAASFLLTLTLSQVLDQPSAVLTTLGIGITKEVYDKYKVNPTGFDWKDIAADCIGIGLAIPW